jgi:hypothetical protein
VQQHLCGTNARRLIIDMTVSLQTASIAVKDVRDVMTLTWMIYMQIHP